MLTVNGVKYVTEKEISSRYGLSVSWFRKARYSGNCPTYHKLRGKIFYDTDKVDEWFKDNLKTIQ